MINDLWKNVKTDYVEDLREIDSEYPKDLDFKPGSELHDNIVLNLVNECARRGKTITDACYKEYEKVDNSLDCFMSPDEIDRRRAGKDSRKPINVVIPQQFANLDIFKTGMHKAFFSGRYMHRYRGHGSAARAAKAVIANEVIAQIGYWFNHRRSMDIIWSDCFGYGRGWMWGKWSKKMAPRYDITLIDETMQTLLGDMGGEFDIGEEVRTLSDEMEITKEGTDWINLDPYQVLVDPNVTPDRFQDSEFFGWTVRTDALLLVDLEQDPEEEMFNCKGLPIIAKCSPVSEFYREDAQPANRMPDQRSDRTSSGMSSTVDVTYMMTRIIPKDWNLGDSERPQIWFFAVAGDKLLIKAHQIRARHGLYPVVCAAPNARGHNVVPVSHLMVTQGIAGATDYLVKRRLDFLDTAHNGKFVIDPTKLEYKDFRDSDGPTIIRMKKSAFGAGKISDWYEQLRVDDVTAGTWNDVGSLIQMARDGSGIQEILMGGGAGLPERPTATGIDALQGGALSRLTRAAIVLDEQLHRPKGYMDLCNASQYMATQMIIDIEGNDEEIVRGWYSLPDGATGLSVSSWDIDPELDITPMSNVSQGAKSFAAMTELAKTIMPAFMAQPGAVQAITPFVSQYFREVGIEDFEYMNMTVAPDEMVAQAAQAGQLQPMGMQQ